MTTAVPVSDGFILKKGIRKESLAGNTVSNYAQQVLESMNVKVIPPYMISRKIAVDAGTPSKATMHNRSAIPSFHQFSVNRVLAEFKETVCHVSEYHSPKSRAAKSFEFPDGYNNAFAAERFRIPEAQLQEPVVGAPQLIQSAISSCDVDVRYQLGLNIKFRVTATNSTVERKYGPWIGGSILASLGTFHQMWISKKEYEEKGAAIEKRIP
ncbi:hypothetical protein BC829DRAFT_445568 [Chytridium lagenaria]|nr:hypothetical protein BC829DRAFT_445568 [Chytridium lagenaria]